MRLLLPLFASSLLAIVPAIASAQGLPDELRRMLDCLDSAETIEVTVESRVDSMGTWTTQAASAPGNRLRLEMSIHLPQAGETQRAEFVTDGTSLVSTTSGRTQRSSAHPGLKERFQTSLGRTGFLYSYLTPIGQGKVGDQSLAELVTLSNGAIVKQRKVKARQLTVITYDFTFNAGEASKVVSCCLWVDAQSHLPVKRTFQLQSHQVTETYTGWKINRPVPSETFEAS